ncbi:polyprenyl synthetase family protein [Streptomyces millisiae]|uniref:Polyprenyl synthetase family protein n=1 Tax=Streptomyces millisiae TaxID=3075542 RepID=A0ABU2LHM8_9ACTN|nr:polyprenyl synthetase family protein [Streptomyces sp. DSM 44918]MDT0317092.1 polyprenyl synthetase family protein [Streptomyces sp. DSM 44918]
MSTDADERHADGSSGREAGFRWAGGAAAAVVRRAIELAHVGSLLHDDILDGEDMRRGRHAPYRRFGIPRAILTGDEMLFASFEQVVRCGEQGVPARAVQQAVGVLAGAGRDIAAGVARELTCTAVTRRSSPESALADYTETVRLERAALPRASCELGDEIPPGPHRRVLRELIEIVADDADTAVPAARQRASDEPF